MSLARGVLVTVAAVGVGPRDVHIALFEEDKDTVYAVVAFVL